MQEGETQRLSQLIQQYDKLRKDANNAISSLITTYKNVFEKYEKQWFTWDVDFVVVWFRFQLFSIGTTQKNIDLDQIRRNMKAAKWKGERMNMIKKSHLRDFGFANYLDYTRLYKLIQEMTNKYQNQT